MKKCKILFIVESPSKAKTIKGYLGDAYNVVATNGHIRSLARKNDGVQIIDNKLQFKWILDTKKFSNILKGAKVADSIILAVDADREGEAIGWHVIQTLKEKKIELPYNRISFNSITKRSILDAIKNPKSLNQNLINAYLTRISFDFIFGFSVSPVLWKILWFFGRRQSAGRVQSVALRLISDRDIERQKFTSIKYHSITAFMNDNGDTKECKLYSYEGERIQSHLDYKDAHHIYTHISSYPEQQGEIVDIRIKDKQIAPKAPFRTSTLQQYVSNKLGLKISEVMSIAQQLYEGGYITYHRSDSTFMSMDFIDSIRTLINHKYAEYLPVSAISYDKKTKNAQEAHECIRPTDINICDIDSLSDKHNMVYDIIRKRTISSQMKHATQTTITTSISVANAIFTYNHSSYTFKSFEIFNPIVNKSTPWSVKKGNKYHITSYKMYDHETKPPALFTEASLIKQLELLGIGRPSTYARTINVLNERKYIQYLKRSLSITKRGHISVSILVHCFSTYMDYHFTSCIETSLNNIVNGAEFMDILQHFTDNIQELVTKSQSIETTDVYSIAMKHSFINTTCDSCGSNSIQLQHRSRIGICFICQSCTYEKPVTVNKIMEFNTSRLFTGEEYTYLKIQDRETSLYLPKNFCTEITKEIITYLETLPKTITHNGIEYKFASTANNFYIKRVDTNKYLNFKTIEKMMNITMEELENHSSLIAN